MQADQIQDLLTTLFETLIDARDEIEGDDDDITLADFARDMAAEAEDVKQTRSYEEVLMLTTDAGLVLRMNDGSEFQITIVRSR
jgi:hypothetical protein